LVGPRDAGDRLGNRSAFGGKFAILSKRGDDRFEQFARRHIADEAEEVAACRIKEIAAPFILGLVALSPDFVAAPRELRFDKVGGGRQPDKRWAKLCKNSDFGSTELNLG